MRGGLFVASSAAAAALALQLGVAQAEPQAPEEWDPEVEQQRRPHHLRSFAEMGAGLGLGLGGYWLFKKGNATDWDNPQIKQRLDGAAWTLDNNGLGLNFLGHPLTGALSYELARGNHQSVAGAFAYSFLTSFLWEFVIEFKEKVSINDVLVTPGAGLPLGEFFYKLGLYLDTAREGSAAASLARWTLGTGVALDRSWDGRPAPLVRQRDNLGLSVAMWHELFSRYGVAAVNSAGEIGYSRISVAAGGRLVTLRGYARAATLSRGFWGGEISDFSLGIEGSRYGAGLLVEADTVLAGYHTQRLAGAPTAPRGGWLTVGASVGYEYLSSFADRSAVTERAVQLPQAARRFTSPTEREQFAALDLPGLALELRGLRPWGSIDISGRLEPSFGGLEASAFYDWVSENPDERSKHILERHGYFYGWGASSRVRARLALGPWRASFELKYASYSSQDGLDRHQEQVTNDVHAAGDVLRYLGSIGVAPSRLPVTLALEFGERRFHSRVGGFEATSRWLERGVSASWRF